MARFEVYVSRGGRFSLQADFTDKAEAVSHAKALFGRNEFDAVKVTEGPEGPKEKVAFIQERAAKQVTIVPQKDAPVCNDLEDFYGFESRKLIGRLLRKFLDDQGITAFELLFSYGYLRMLSRTDTLYYQAVGSIGALHARKTGERQQDRTDFLYAAFEKVEARAKKIGEAEKFVSIVQGQGFAALCAALANEPPARRDYFVRAGLANHLLNARTWESKLELLLAEIDRGPGGDAMRMLDEVLAEILDGADAMREILGGQADLLAALLAMTRVTEGSYEPRGGGGSKMLERLNTTLPRPGLDMARGVLMDRVIRTLEGTAKLTKGGAPDERKAFGEFLKFVVRDKGVLGGAPMAEAVTERARLVLGDGGTLKVGNAIDRTVLLIPERPARVGYLEDLNKSSYAEEHAEAIQTNLERLR